MQIQKEFIQDQGAVSTRQTDHSLWRQLQFSHSWGDEDTFVVTHGKDGHVWDADGNRYIDYRLGFGPIILGHAFPGVTEKAQKCCNTATFLPGQPPSKLNWLNALRGMTGMTRYVSPTRGRKRRCMPSRRGPCPHGTRTLHQI